MYIITIPQTLFPDSLYYWAENKWVSEEKYARPFLELSEARTYLNNRHRQFRKYSGKINILWIDRNIDIAEVVEGLKDI